MILDRVGAPQQQRVGIFTGAHDLDARVQALVDSRRLEVRREAADNSLTVAARYRRVVFARRDASDGPAPRAGPEGPWPRGPKGLGARC